MDCIFCKIINGDIPCKKVLETDTVLAFHDIDPKAPTHILIIPKEHISSVSDITDTQADVLSDMTRAARDIAKDIGLVEKGYRLVMNEGDDGGQAVAHIHMHLLGGRQLTWPPG